MSHVIRKRRSYPLGLALPLSEEDPSTEFTFVSSNGLSTRCELAAWYPDLANH